MLIMNLKHEPYVTVVRRTNRLSNHKIVGNGGHWGVGINAETRELLVAISLLIRCGRVKQALSIIDNELAGGC